MSRVLARSMFKKNAPKRSAKGVGITSMLEDDVAGYKEGGEVTDDRTERERLARQLLERNRDEGDMYQRFAEQERPQMYRPAATMGMVQPQPNPQQMQAMQMQQMAQMGMLPRFQQGGQVNAAVEVPSMWSRMRQGIASTFDRGNRTSPMFARGSGPEIYASPLGSNIGSPAMDNPEFRYRPPAMPIKDMPYSDPMGGYTGGTEPPPMAPGQGFGLGIPDIARPMLGLPTFREPEKGPPSEADQAAMEADREARRAKGMSKLPFKPTPKEERREEGGPGAGPGAGGGKETDLSAIKADREAKAAAARQENIYLALMQAGLAIAGGKSSNAITNIGQGGQAGLASFVALEQQRRRDEDAAMRRDLAEREYGLQARRLAMQEPYYQAQTEYLRTRPQMAADKIEADRQKMLFLARTKADAAVQAEVAKNPFSPMYVGKDGKPDPIKIAAEIQKRTQRILLEGQLGGSQGSGVSNRLGLDLPDTSGED